jgi:hypothetical protein
MGRRAEDGGTVGEHTSTGGHRITGKSLERLLTALGQPTEVRERAPPRGPPYFARKVVRQTLLGLRPEPGLFD